MAVDGLLDREDRSDEVTLRVRVTDGGLEAELGPFDGSGIRSDLERGAGEELGLRRILDALVDEVRVEARDDGAWVVLQKGRSE